MVSIELKTSAKQFLARYSLPWIQKVKDQIFKLLSSMLQLSSKKISYGLKSGKIEVKV